MNFKSFFSSKKQNQNDQVTIDTGKYGSFEFNMREFSKTLTPEALIKAIHTRSGVNIPTAFTPIESLNKLLANQDLYKALTLHPEESMERINKLKEGQPLGAFAVKELNRLLIEKNYPLETPKRQLFFSS